MHSNREWGWEWEWEWEWDWKQEMHVAREKGVFTQEERGVQEWQERGRQWSFATLDLSSRDRYGTLGNTLSE